MSEQPWDGGAIPEWDLPDRMRKGLRHAGVGVQEIAEYLGVARNTVSAWINGRIDPSTQTLRLWALRCGVPYEWLRDGTVTGGGGTRAPYDGVWVRRSPSPTYITHRLRRHALEMAA